MVDRADGGAYAATLVALGVDAHDPRRMARFWAAALVWDIDDDTDDDRDEVRLAPTDGTRFTVVFRRVDTPKVGQNRNHLDLTTESLEDQRETVDQLILLGGSHIDIGQTPEEGHVVLADPEGNELCILAPGNQFLAGTKRLGAVNCDGTRRVGVFWSEVLGWPLVWDQDGETAIRAPDLTGPLITWSGPPLMPKHGRNRLHLEIAPAPGVDQQTVVDRLVSLGASPVADDRPTTDWVVLADPDDNELYVLNPVL